MQIKISAKLNNCALHCLTPEIRDRVVEIANKKEENNENYNTLKNLFANFYNIQNLSWPEFAELLKTFNAHDLQIVLGPVLREFMKKMINKNNLTSSKFNTSDELSKNLCELCKSSGRYQSLEMSDVHFYIASHLGFDVIGGLKDSFKKIVMYHSGGNGAENGGHWERCENPEIYTIASDFPNIVEFFNDNPIMVSKGFILLKAYVNAIYNKKNDLVKKILEKAGEIIEYYNSNSSSIDSKLQQKLLTIHSEYNTVNNLPIKEQSDAIQNRELVVDYLNDLYKKVSIYNDSQNNVPQNVQHNVQDNVQHENTAINNKWIILKGFAICAAIVLIALTALAIISLWPGVAASIAAVGLYGYAHEKEQDEIASLNPSI